MAKNIVNLIAALLFGILTVGITTTVLGAEITGLIPISLESIEPEKNPYLGSPSTMLRSIAFMASGWMKKQVPGTLV